MSFLTPLGLLAGLLAIPIILLYMLRLRRREVVVSSHFLWQKVVQDQEANTPWQRLRRNWLMILQLLILAFLVLALARPAQIVPSIIAGKTVILLDASASMQSQDAPEGRTRFQEAQRQANIVVGNLAFENEVSIIRVGETAEPLTAFTYDINLIRTAINNAQVGQGRGDWETALTLAAAGAEGADSFSIIVISDGNLGDSVRLPENIPQPNYIQVGTASDNIAIQGLATRDLPGQAPQLFALVENYGTQDNEVSLVVRVDGELWTSETRTVSARSQRSFFFTVDVPFESMSAELLLDDEVVDYLPVDNEAFTVASSSSTRRVLLVDGSESLFLRQIFSSLPNTEVFRGDAARATLPAQEYDLYVFNDYLPDVLPDADVMVINPPRSTSLFTLSNEVEVVAPFEMVERSHPLAAFMNLQSIVISRYHPVAAVDWATPIISANNDPLVLAGETQGRQVVLMPFNINDSNFALNIAFPILMINSMDWFSAANIIAGSATYRVGDVVAINPPLGAESVRVTLPDGERQTLDLTGETLSFADTGQLGIYQFEVLQDNEIISEAQIAVNLFGTGESDITPQTDIIVGGGVSETEAEEQLGYREFWIAATVLALMLLLYEWYVHHRRLRPPGENFSFFDRLSRVSQGRAR